jgi:hypothetical protein
MDPIHNSMIVFSSELCERLSRERLAPVYIGVRSVRPTVRPLDPPSAPMVPPPVYKIMTEEGQERRMTAQEKKRAKRQYQQETAARSDRTLLPETHRVSDGATAAQSSQYLPLSVDPRCLAEEMADSHPTTIPPVLLSPALAHCARRYLPVSLVASEMTPSAAMDDTRAAQWAAMLQQRCLMPAERIRHRETGVRPLPYRIVPQVWRRLRPPEMCADAADPEAPETRIPFATPPPDLPDHDWCTLRPGPDQEDAAAIVHLLHPHVHISCGAKFGAHYLLYDGPRHERHAFAGLRILPSADGPLPNAYDLAGYVRGLNTAGKLALLATTVVEDRRRCVLFLDLTLEKVAVTTTRRPQKTLAQRLQNLAKRPAPPP